MTKGLVKLKKKIQKKSNEIEEQEKKIHSLIFVVNLLMEEISSKTGLKNGKVSQ
mgnify:FL=1|tara:strand:- start:264 stop:425 length:162 start_codon:yes stop_codon:yes gene_type:complete